MTYSYPPALLTAMHYHGAGHWDQALILSIAHRPELAALTPDEWSAALDFATWAIDQVVTAAAPPNVVALPAAKRRRNAKSGRGG